MNNTPHKKIAFFGTPDFTKDFLDMLAREGFAPSLIVTNPDRPVGRGMVMTAPLPKVWAQEHTVTVLQPEKLDDAFFENLQETKWDLFIVIAYGKIIPEQIINLPKHGTINLHYSLLPKYRGATPTESAILHGDTVTGVTIQQMVCKLDAGDILAVQEVPIAPDDTTPTLRAKLNAEALTLFPHTLEKLFAGELVPIPQDESLATRCGKISKEDGLVNLADDPLTLWRTYRAYQPWPGLYFFAEKNEKQIRVKINNAVFENNQFTIISVTPEGGKPQPFESFKHSYLL